MKNYKLFISYSTRNKKRAEKLAKILMINNINVWWDRWEVLVGHKIYDKVYDGVMQSEFLGIIITQASIKSKWVQEELSLARQKEFEQNKIVILPLLFEKVDIPMHLKTRRFADFTNFEKGINELLDVLQVDKNVFNYDVLKLVQKKLFDENILINNLQQHVIQSQPEKRLRISTAYNPLISKLSNKSINSGNLIKLYIHLDSLHDKIPILINENQKIEKILDILSRLFVFSEINNQNRFNFFIIHNDKILNIEDTIFNLGIKNNDEVKIGCYTYLIE